MVRSGLFGEVGTARRERDEGDAHSSGSALTFLAALRPRGMVAGSNLGVVGVGGEEEDEVDRDEDEGERAWLEPTTCSRAAG